MTTARAQQPSLADTPYYIANTPEQSKHTSI